MSNVTRIFVAMFFVFALTSVVINFPSEPAGLTAEELAVEFSGTTFSEPNIDHFAKDVDLKIAIEQPGHENVRSFHTNMELSRESTVRFVFPIREYQLDEFLSMGHRGASLVASLEHIEGINEVTMRRYEVVVSKGKMFSWDDIGPAVSAAITGVVNIPSVVIAKPQVADAPEQSSGGCCDPHSSGFMHSF